MSRTNLCTNPSLDVNNTGWGGGETPVRTSVAGFPKSFAARYSTSTFMLGPSGAATPGLVYYVSVYVKPASFQPSGTLAIQWNDSGGSELSETTISFPTASAGSVTRVSLSGTAPASTVTMRLLHFGENYAVNLMDFSAALYEQAGSLGGYFDGDTAGAVWNGTAGNSTSTLLDAATTTPHMTSQYGGYF